MAMISNAVSSKIFPYKKFIQWDEELEHGSKVQRALCRELNVSNKNSQEFWRSYKEKTRYKMTRKRNNVLEQLRRAMIGKLQKEARVCPAAVFGSDEIGA